MFAEPLVRTLWEDWHDRRRRLTSGTGRPEQHCQVQIRILDYLIRRYRDSPEAARPARSPMQSDVFVNDRAIVVHHHVWNEKVGGVKNEREAHDRVASILKRMTSAAADDAAGARPDLPRHPAQESGGAQRTAFAIRFGFDAYSAIEAALRKNPFLSEWVVRYLYDRVVDPDREEIRAARLLVRCKNRSVSGHVLVAWRTRLEHDRVDKVTEVLEDYLRRPKTGGRPGETIQAELACTHARVRLHAIAIVGAIGNLDDIGLLSDLLLLPRLDDEAPGEREALIRAIRQIAGAG